MKEQIIGIRIDRETGIAFFGIDEINTALQQGARVVAVQQGEALFERTAADDEHVRLTFSGFGIKIILEG